MVAAMYRETTRRRGWVRLFLFFLVLGGIVYYFYDDLFGTSDEPPSANRDARPVEVYKHPAKFYPPMTPDLVFGLLGNVDNEVTMTELKAELGRAAKDKLDLGKLQLVLEGLRHQGYPGEGTGADLEKLRFVKHMMRHAWDGYARNAWGANEIKPISGQPSDGFLTRGKIGVFILDAMDTLLVMGMHDEYVKAREWVEKDLSFDVNADVSLFETTIRVLGGLLSAYALTGDRLLLDKATDIGDRLHAGVVEKQVPDAWVNLQGNTDHQAGTQSLAELGTLHLEFHYLSTVTQNPKYLEAVEKLRDLVERNKPNEGRYTGQFNGHSWSGSVTIGAYGDSFYEYLLKSYIQTGGEDNRAFYMYLDATAGLMGSALQKYGETRIFKTPLEGGAAMEHLACFSGGMFALGSQYIREDDKKAEHFKVGEDMTSTCYRSYDATRTKLGPEIIRVNNNGDFDPRSGQYKLRPETIESIMYMWRLTKDPKYRQWGWQIARAIELHARTEHGYAIVSNVDEYPAPLSDQMPSFLLAETFKYLYLLFASDDLLPLDDWVFNTEAHPLPIRNRDTSDLVKRLSAGLRAKGTN